MYTGGNLNSVLLQYAERFKCDGYLLDTVSNRECILFFVKMGGPRDWVWQMCTDACNYLSLLRGPAQHLLWWYFISCAHGASLARNLCYVTQERECCYVSYHFCSALPFARTGALVPQFVHINTNTNPTKLWITGVYQAEELSESALTADTRSSNRKAPYNYADFIFGRAAFSLADRFALARTVVRQANSDPRSYSAGVRRLFVKHGLLYYSFDRLAPVVLSAEVVLEQLSAPVCEVLKTKDVFAFTADDDQTCEALVDCARELLDFSTVSAMSAECALMFRVLDLRPAELLALCGLFSGVLCSTHINALYGLLDSASVDERSVLLRSVLLQVLPPDAFSLILLHRARATTKCSIDTEFVSAVHAGAAVCHASELTTEFCRNIIIKGRRLV